MELIANTKPVPASMRSALLDESANCDRLLASPRGNDANMGKCYLGYLISCKRLSLSLSETNDW